jgi:hypothetical protein
MQAPCGGSTDSLICSSVNITSDASTIQNCSEGSISLKLAGIFYNELAKFLILFISAQEGPPFESGRQHQEIN